MTFRQLLHKRIAAPLPAAALNDSAARGPVGLKRPAPTVERLSDLHRGQLIELAQRSIRDTILGCQTDWSWDSFDGPLHQPRGCFVTVRVDQCLRGCLGNLFPREPLCRAVAANAAATATRDLRFTPLQAAELPSLQIQISVLTEPQRLTFSSCDQLLDQLRPHQDGVILQLGKRTSTFLPQVWAHYPDKQTFLSQLAIKAGHPELAWRRSDCAVLVYEAECFGT